VFFQKKPLIYVSRLILIVLISHNNKVFSLESPPIYIYIYLWLGMMCFYLLTIVVYWWVIVEYRRVSINCVIIVCMNWWWVIRLLLLFNLLVFMWMHSHPFVVCLAWHYYCEIAVLQVVESLGTLVMYWYEYDVLNQFYSNFINELIFYSSFSSLYNVSKRVFFENNNFDLLIHAILWLKIN
jgi:hypothetical protein